jgi:hypothetical protein
MSEHQKQILQEKRDQYEAGQKAFQPVDADDAQYPAGANLCVKCNTKAVILMDGCMTCLCCGDSKCG